MPLLELLPGGRHAVKKFGRYEYRVPADSTQLVPVEQHVHTGREFGQLYPLKLWVGLALGNFQKKSRTIAECVSVYNRSGGFRMRDRWHNACPSLAHGRCRIPD